MTRYLLDTGIAGDYINRRRGVFQRARQEVAIGNIIGVGTPTLGELWDGVENSRTRTANIARLRRAIPDWKRWSFDDAAAQVFGRLRAHLRRIGRMMQSIDLQLAAIALSMGNTIVVTSDTDLAAVPGLPVENWATP